MKQDKYPMGLDYYRLYLIRHLREHYFPQFTNERFITERCEDAYDTFVTLRLEGHTIDYCQEMAMRTLLKGLYVSRYDILYSVVEDNVELRLPQEYWPDFTIHLLTIKSLHDILDRYEVNGDFLSRETHQPMLNELLGAITEILDSYGL